MHALAGARRRAHHEDRGAGEESLREGGRRKWIRMGEWMVADDHVRGGAGLLRAGP